MKISARNILNGTVKSIEHGAVNSEIIVELAPGVELTSVITKQSAESLGLEVGKPAAAIIKSSAIMLGTE